MHSLFKTETEEAFTPAFRQKSRELAQAINVFLDRYDLVPPASLAELSNMQDAPFTAKDFSEALIIGDHPQIAAALLYEGGNLAALDCNTFVLRYLHPQAEHDPKLYLAAMTAPLQNSPQNAMLSLQLMPTTAGRNVYESVMSLAQPLLEQTSPLETAAALMAEDSQKEVSEEELLFEADMGGSHQLNTDLYDRFLVKAYIKACNTNDAQDLLVDLRTLAEPWLSALHFEDTQDRETAAKILIATALLPFAEHFQAAGISSDVFYGSGLERNWSDDQKIVMSGPLAIMINEGRGFNFTKSNPFYGTYLTRALEMINGLGLSITLDEMLNQQSLHNKVAYQWALETEPPYAFIERSAPPGIDIQTAWQLFRFFQGRTELVVHLSHETNYSILMALAVVTDPKSQIGRDVMTASSHLYSQSPGFKSHLVENLAKTSGFTPNILDIFQLTSRDVRHHLGTMNAATRRHLIEHDFSI